MSVATVLGTPSGMSFALTNTPTLTSTSRTGGDVDRATVLEAFKSLPPPAYGSYASGTSSGSSPAVVPPLALPLPTHPSGAVVDHAAATSDGGDDSGGTARRVSFTPAPPSQAHAYSTALTRGSLSDRPAGNGVASGRGPTGATPLPRPAWAPPSSSDVLLSSTVRTPNNNQGGGGGGPGGGGGSSTMALTLRAAVHHAHVVHEMEDKGVTLNVEALEVEWAQRYWSYVCGPDAVAAGRPNPAPATVVDPLFIRLNDHAGGAGAQPLALAAAVSARGASAAQASTAIVAATGGSSSTSTGALDDRHRTLSSLLPPMKESWLENVKRLLPPAPTTAEGVDAANAVLTHLLAWVGINYVHAARKAVLDYVLRDPGERRRLNIMRVPESIAGPVAGLEWGWGAQRALVTPPEPWRARVGVARVFIASHVHGVRAVVAAVVADWTRVFDLGASLCVVDLPLLDAAALTAGWRPMELAEFEAVSFEGGGGGEFTGRLAYLL